MADFRLRGEVDEWFRHIQRQDPFKTKFDRYYLCVLLGLAGGLESDPQDAIGFVDSFVEDYEDHQLLLTALLLRADLHLFGIELEDRDEVRDHLGKLVGPAGLTAKGVSRLNRYASGGFDLLVARYGTALPYSPEEFLPRYVEILKEAAAKQPLWQE